MSTATLSGHRVVEASLHLSAWGVPWAEVTVGEQVELAGAVELAIADLTFAGTIVSGGVAKGIAHYRIAGGAGGWGQTIGPNAYANDAGVKLATVLGDAAAAAGETLEASSVPVQSVGPHYVREEGPASRVLNALAPSDWYVCEDGITRLGKRPEAPLAVEARLGPVNRAQGTVTLAAEAIASIVPGVVVNELVAVDVVHRVSGKGGLRSTIYGERAAATSRRLAAYAAIVHGILPTLSYYAPHEYRVVTQSGERLNLQIVQKSTGMPDLERVPVRGAPGLRAEVALGARVTVAWLNGDPSRPVVVGFEEAEASGFKPARIYIDADRLDLGGSSETGVDAVGAAGRVVRYGDPILFGAPGAGVVALPATGSLSRVRG